MMQFHFDVASDLNGKRYIYFKNAHGEKLFEWFCETSYTAERLFEEMKNEFPSCPWQLDWTDEQHRDFDPKDTCCELIDVVYADKEFSSIVMIVASEQAVYAEFQPLQMNGREKQLFDDLLECLKKYCRAHELALCVWNESGQRMEEITL